MALLWLDGLDKYTATADLAIRDYVAGAVSSNETQYQGAAGRGGGGAVRTRKNSVIDCSDGLQIPLPSAIAAGDTIHIAAWIKCTLADLSNPAIINFTHSANGRNAGIRIHSTGSDYGIETQSFRGSVSFVDEAASPGYLSTKNGVYVHLEVAYSGDPTAGTCKVWLDENLVIDFTGDTTSGFTMETIDQVCIGGRTIDWDDIVIWSDDGADFAPAQLKRHKIETLSPDAAGSDTDFVPFSMDSPPEANWETVAEAGFHDGDDSYVSSGNDGDRDIYSLANISSNPHIVYAVALNTRAKWVTDPFNLTAILKQGASEATDALTLTSAYAHYQSLFYVDPDTAAEFTPAGLNSMQAGFEQVTPP